MINADKPELWEEDIAKSVEQYNDWFMNFAPNAYKETRLKTRSQVRDGLEILNDLLSLNPETIKGNPRVVSVLRMCTSPPLARDRLTGLGALNKSFLESLEEGKVPSKDLDKNLESICDVIGGLIDKDIFPWVAEGRHPIEEQRIRASSIVADRLCSAVANPLIKNAQEQRQLQLIEIYLQEKGYEKANMSSDGHVTDMEKGTYSLRMNVPYINEETGTSVNLPLDVVIQRKGASDGELPILIECKSAGDFTNTNKRRKEEAKKMHQLKETYGTQANLTLFLCGYFNEGYLSYEAAEKIDWVWEHRVEDLDKLGL